MINNFNEYAIKNNEMHPIAKLFHEAMLAVEKLGASEEQTDAIIKLGKCKGAVEKILSSDIDWNAIEKEYNEWLKGNLVTSEEGAFIWFRSRPEFQLRQNWEERAVGFAEWIIEKTHSGKDGVLRFKDTERQTGMIRDLLQLYKQSPEYKESFKSTSHESETDH